MEKLTKEQRIAAIAQLGSMSAEDSVIVTTVERRWFPLDAIDYRDAGGADTPAKITGHASVFNVAADLGYFIETVKPGAFTKTIVEDDIRALFNHEPNLILGRNKANTLTLSEDAIGLAFSVLPSDRSYELDLMKSIRRGDVTQASIGFMTRSRLIREDGDNLYRDLIDLKLFDVSPVTYPAFTSTDVSMRSLQIRAIAMQDFRRGSETESTSEEWKHDLDRRRRQLELARD